MANKTERTISVPLIVLALLIGMIVSFGERVVFALALDRSVDLSEWGVIVGSGVLTAFPFLYLALQRSLSLKPWLVGVAITLAASGWWLSKGVAYQKAPDGSGVDMFGAMLMLLAPFVITALVAAIDHRIARPSE